MYKIQNVPSSKHERSTEYPNLVPRQYRLHEIVDCMVDTINFEITFHLDRWLNAEQVRNIHFTKITSAFFTK